MRLIDADALWDELTEDLEDGDVLYRIPPNAIDDAPTVDAVPVVRCGVCKFWEPYGSKGSRNGEDLLELEGGCMKWRGRHLESDFCSFGEPKEG